MNKLFLATAFGLVGLPAVERPVVQAQQKTVLVSGVITGPDYTPISGVSIRAERDGVVVGGPSNSELNGEYKLEVTEGEAVNIIYDHARWQPEVLQRLSASKNHSINKVLLARVDQLGKFAEAAGLTKEQTEQVDNILATSLANLKSQINEQKQKQASELGKVLTEAQRARFSQTFGEFAVPESEFMPRRDEQDHPRREEESKGVVIFPPQEGEQESPQREKLREQRKGKRSVMPQQLGEQKTPRDSEKK
jgi:hypothetical protein